MASCSRIAATALAMAAAAVLAVNAGSPGIELRQYSYLTIRTPPFNGQLALYAPDIVSSSGRIRLPLTVHVLLGNGRRPFATDAGTMKPQDFTRYVQQAGTKSLRVMPFRITRKEDRLVFDYLGRSYAVSVLDLIACSGCADRIVLNLQPEPVKRAAPQVWRLPGRPVYSD